MNTIDNLKTAIAGESEACAKYAAFAIRAEIDGYPSVRRLFQATSYAERIHATNHAKILLKLGEKLAAQDFNFTVSSTVENLTEGIAGETYEFTTMYPPMIATAQEEGDKNAVRSFTWAMEAEKDHAKLYQQAISIIESGNLDSLPEHYYVCPLCGDVFDAKDAVAKCPLCGLPAEKFVQI